MEKQEEKFEDELGLSIFDIEEEEGLIINDDDDDDEEKDDEEKQEKVEKSDDVSKKDDNTDDDDEEDNDDDDDDDDDTSKTDVKTDEDEDDSDLSEEEKTLSEFISNGIILLPEDYEYEPTKEGLAKALEDSEKFRNQLAFQEAIKFLVSDEGIDFVKVQKAKENINVLESYEELDTDSKLEIIKQSYIHKGLDESDIDEILEEAIDADKILEKELRLAAKYLKKFKEKELEEEAQKPLKAKQEMEEQYEQSQQVFKKVLGEVEEHNGYIIAKDNKQKIFNAIYKPIKLKDGTLTTEFQKKLSDALNNPETLVVLTDILVSMDEKGFNFKPIVEKAESKATVTIKKTLRDLKQSGGKSKITGKTAQTRKDFDLSKASLFG